MRSYNDDVIVIGGTRAAAGGLLGLGAVACIVGGYGVSDGAWRAGVAAPILAIGVVVVAYAVLGIVRHRPQLRATAEGISFGGAAAIPWTDIKQVYVGRTKSALGNVVQSETLAIDLHRRRAMLRLPFTYWIAAPFAFGDIDVTLDKADACADVVASRLEAMRVCAVGTEDGRIAGATELPAAIVKR